VGFLDRLRPATARKPLVRLYASDAALQDERNGMRAKGLFLSSASELADGRWRAVWVSGRHHEIKQV